MNGRFGENLRGQGAWSVIADGICRVVKDSAILFALRDDGGSCLWPQVNVSGRNQRRDRVKLRSDRVQEKV